MTFLVRFKVLVLVLIPIISLPNTARSYDPKLQRFYHNDEYISLIIDISKLHGTKSIILLYGQSIEGKKIIYVRVQSFLQFYYLNFFPFFLVFSTNPFNTSPLSNGNRNDDIPMDACTFSRGLHDLDHVLQRIAKIVTLHQTNRTAALRRNYNELRRDQSILLGEKKFHRAIRRLARVIHRRGT